MTVELQRFLSAAELREAAEAFLMRDEAKHNLILGMIGRLGRTPDYYGRQAYFAVARRGGSVAGVAVMTPPFPLVLSLCKDEEAVAALARDVRDFLPETPGVNSTLPEARIFADAWRRLTGESYGVALTERVYRLERLEAPRSVEGRPRHAAEPDVAWLAEWMIEFAREAVPWDESPRDVTEERLRRGLALPREIGGVLIWEVNSEPVCIAGYGNPTPNSMRIGPLYTPPEQRRRGYASACTAAACEHVLASGKRFVTLFADVANPTSNHVYQAIGFEAVCDAAMIRFGGR